MPFPEKEFKKMKEASINTLKVIYNAKDGGINTFLDDDLKRFFRKYGLKCWASGMGIETRKRDLNFRRER